MDLASVVAALASVGVRVSGSNPNNNIQGDSSRACPTGLAGPEPSGTHNDPGQHFHAHTHFGLAPQRRLLRLANVVCEPWGPLCITPMSYMVHWSMRPACTGGLNIVHGGQQKWKIAQNDQKCAHSWLGQMRHMPDLDQSVP